MSCIKLSYADRVELGRRGRFRAYAFSLGDRAPGAPPPAEIASPPPLATHLATSVSDSSLSTVAAPPEFIDAFASAPMDVDLGADGDPTSFLSDDALAELVGEALAPAATVTPEASPGLTPCGCRIQPTQFFQ